MTEISIQQPLICEIDACHRKMKNLRHVNQSNRKPARTCYPIFHRQRLNVVQDVFAKKAMYSTQFQNCVWDGTSRVYIDAPPEYRGKTKGLCGTFSSNIQDDFLTPEGDIESSVASFANKWRTKETCQYVSDGFIPHPCHLNIENKEIAIQTCAKLKEEVFAECHWSVDVSLY